MSLHSSEFGFQVAEDSLSRKKTQQTKPPVLPHMPWIRHVHPTTQALLHNVVPPHTYRQPLSVQPLSSVGFCWQHSDLQTKGTVPKFHEFLNFPPTSSSPCSCPRAATSFPVEYFPLALLDKLLSPLLSLIVTIWPLKWFIKSNFSAKPALTCIKDVPCQCQGEVPTSTIQMAVPRIDATKKTLPQPAPASSLFSQVSLSVQ